MLGVWSFPAAFAADTPTFNKDVAPILFQNCVSCHRPGEAAPFSLLTYVDAQKKAKSITRVTHERYMPPWQAEPNDFPFVGERRLTDTQIATIQKWVEGGAPQGIGFPPLAPKFTEGWQFGQPDLVLKMTEAYSVPAEGRDIYQNFVIPMGLKEDKYVTAVEFRPGNRKILHHSILYTDTSGTARKLDDEFAGPGYRKFGGPGFQPSGTLGGWVPGATPHPLTNGTARIVHKGSDLVLASHFHPSGKAETEQSEIGLYFAKQKPQKLMVTIPLMSFLLDIPPGKKDYITSATFNVPIDIQVIGIWPHAHLLGKEIRVTATFPDAAGKPTGPKKDLIWIKKWDFNWQDQYQYKTPVKLPRGTQVVMTHTYDNSTDNPANPSTPPKRVRWGEQTTDEMAICFVNAVPDNPLIAAILNDALTKQRRSSQVRPRQSNN